jgi:lysozyme family protein
MSTLNARALQYVLENEGGYANVGGDPGGETRWGITEAVARANGYQGAMRDLPLEMALDIYHQRYWRQSWINDQRVATKVFDASVNLGGGAALKLLQRAAGVEADGCPGPKTQQAVNEATPEALLAGLCTAMAAYYMAIVQVRPDRQKFLKGWLARAARVPE